VNPFRRRPPAVAWSDPAQARTAQLPRVLWIELTSRCPFDCVFCSRRLLRGAGRHLDFDLYRRLIAELDAPEIVRLNYSGESAHYPHLVTFINSGGPGENSDWGVANLESKVLSHHPDLVFIEFSYNDAHEKFEMPLERGAENLNRMVNAIRSRNPGTSIVLQTMNVGWDAPNGNRSASVRPHLQEFNDNYRRYAAAHGIPLLDHSLHWKKLKEDDAQLFQSYVPDGSHPTPDASLAVTWPPIEAFLSACHKSATQTS